MDQEIKNLGNESQNLATESGESPRPAQERCDYCGEAHVPNDGTCDPNETIYFEDAYD